MKFAWVIQGPCVGSSSYTQQVNLFSGELHEQYGIESAVANVPALDYMRYQALLINHLKEFKPDFLVSFGDYHLLNLPQLIGIPQLTWIFLSEASAPDFRGNWPGVTFGCISRHAQEKILPVVPEALYVPHAYDPDVFSPGEKEASRAYLGIPQDRPVVAMVGTNYGDDVLKFDRKNWLGGIEAFAGLLRTHPDALLYIHSNVEGEFIHLLGAAEYLGIDQSVMFSDQEHFTPGEGWDYPISYVAEVYRAADVLLFPSIEEGFGLPIIEAQACGTPVVASNSGPMAELVVTGTAVETSPMAVKNRGYLRPTHEGMVSALQEWLDATPKRVSEGVQDFAISNVVESAFYPAIEATLDRGKKDL